MLSPEQRVARPWLVELEALRKGHLFNRPDAFWPHSLAGTEVWPAFSLVTPEYGQLVRDDAETPLADYRGMLCFTLNS